MSWDDFEELFAVVERMIVKKNHQIPISIMIFTTTIPYSLVCHVVFLNFSHSDTTRLVANLSADTTDHLNMSRWSDASDFP